MILVTAALFVLQGGLPQPAAAGSPTTLVHFDFDDAQGGADAQGWQPFRRFDSDESHFHVEDFSGVGHETGPLAGSRSLWCGLTAEDPRTCSWVDPPGFGPNWNENLISTEFQVAGDVQLGFLMDVGIENSYDFVVVAWEDPTGDWVPLDTYSCGAYSPCGPVLQTYTVPAAAHDGNLRFRFHFFSDGAGDNATGFVVANSTAFVLDDLSVTDDTGLIDFHDFEAEAVNDTVTADGDWYAERNTDANNAGLLVHGADIVQESPEQNLTNFWAFLNGATDDYGCAGFPDQAVVPATRSEIRSPRIDLTRTAAGVPVAGAVDSVEISLDIYRDLDPGHAKLYFWRVFGYSDDCLLSSREALGVAQGDQKEWFRQRIVFSPSPGVTGIEISLGVENINFVAGECRSHAPLLDNIAVVRFGGAVSAAGEPNLPTKLALQQNRPNPFNPATTIFYEVPEHAARVTLRVYDVSGRLVRTLVDGRQAAGPGRIDWNGRNDAGGTVASGVYYYRLAAGAIQQTRRMVMLK